MELRDKVVVITGSGSGIGAAMARRFAIEGAKVIVTDQDATAVEQVAGEIRSVGLAVDITVEDNVKAVADLARRTYGEIDIWYSNAGYSGPRQPGDVQTNEMWKLNWELHVMSHVYAVREVLPAMLARGDGYLIQTASSTALSVQTEKAAYTVSKTAALALSEWLAINFRNRGIKVSCFCPGPMLTPMLLSNNFPDDHPVLKIALTPEEVAALLVDAIGDERFLITDNSPGGADALQKKATSYDGWIAELSDFTM
ncbi:MAG: SDR family NAD(P)-dependent oxidoreductase [Actinobacteria bacterium]|jgi:NAD(P)-dependent dehydrogenase (short-subunit alcohol dehydrogenase family)|uniref:Unannotated protein n=1 Tax=freshwater metagenome TaxID=449393 RepID=A0A6J6Q5J5_9ZZZZ|nr:SDR family NAD(P)-dependent oxidoreductase [Actinomycetota bacterium]MSW77630.1 SDR family NAD(P)-dependent oxidoreductase [Actinomycetota bacterium]MSX55565.1 SDR family NAD(P)-dependent oxidoreductase [Actinomycetota bacterium]MSZ81762.1 SDR family NAD(P)-dependent oxidoreductase [Actinomycetota bacterium]MTB18309.1 SDR family NAD(P)-dependent oxidoreductase [Actinomycetota bacterium]